MYDTRTPVWWPPADGEPIGEERAVELVAWLRTVAPAAVELARQRLQEQNSDGVVTRYAVAARLLASQALAPGMRGLAIGSVGAPASSGGYTVIGIALQRDGRLAITIPVPGEGAQRWELIGDGDTDGRS